MTSDVPHSPDRDSERETVAEDTLLWAEHFYGELERQFLDAVDGKAEASSQQHERDRMTRAFGDPMKLLTNKHTTVLPDGSIVDTPSTRRIINVLDLNSPRMVLWRQMWLRIIDLARRNEPELLIRLLGFPDDLPSLSRRRPPTGNSRPEGVKQSCMAKKQRGELPEFY